MKLVFVILSILSVSVLAEDSGSLIQETATRPGCYALANTELPAALQDVEEKAQAECSVSVILKDVKVKIGQGGCTPVTVTATYFCGR